DQTYHFPQEEFCLTDKGELKFHELDLMQLVKRYGTPLKFNYLPKISQNIQQAQKWFTEAMKQQNYPGNYYYCYCTKSSHFRFVLEEALQNNIQIETSSAFDIDIVKRLKNQGKINDNTYVLCNGFKRDLYISNIADLINGGHQKCIP